MCKKVKRVMSISDLTLLYFSSQCGGVAILVFGAIGLCDPATTASLLSYIPEIPTVENVLYLLKRKSTITAGALERLKVEEILKEFIMILDNANPLF